MTDPKWNGLRHMLDSGIAMIEGRTLATGPLAVTTEAFLDGLRMARGAMDEMEQAEANGEFIQPGWPDMVTVVMDRPLAVDIVSGNPYPTELLKVAVKRGLVEKGR